MGQCKRIVQICQSLFLATIAVMLLVLAFLPASGFVPVLQADSLALIRIEITFAIIGFVAVLAGLFFHRLIGLIGRSARSDTGMSCVHVLRISLFEIVAIFGFIAGMLGSPWYVWLPFLVLTAAAMIFIFLTGKCREERTSETD